MNIVARSSLIMTFFFGMDKALGLIRQLIVTRQFSLTYKLDAFNAANNIPDLLSSLISGGAMGIALIPVLSEYLQNKGKFEAWELFSRIINLAFTITAFISILLAISAPWFVRTIIAPGFPPEQLALSVELMRLDLIAILIFSISGLVMAGLQANQHFLLPAMAPGLYNIGQIFGALILSPEKGFHIGAIVLPAFGFGIHGLVYGVIIGACLHLAVQVPALITHKFHWSPKINLSHPGVRQVLSLLGPRILTMFFIQLFFIVRDNLASRLGEGSVTALNLGWFIMQVPETLFGSALAIALLPTISEQFAQGKIDQFMQSVNSAVKTLFAISIPIASIIALGIQPVVKFAFNFDATGTAMVVMATRIYLIGLLGHALLEITSRSFYAQKNALVPLWAAALNAILYFLCAISLSKILGFAGIATANVISFTSEAFLLLYLLNRKFPGIAYSKNTLTRVIPGSILSVTCVFLVMRLPLAPIFTAILGCLLGLLVVVPFVLPELRIFATIGKKSYSVDGLQKTAV